MEYHLESATRIHLDLVCIKLNNMDNNIHQFMSLVTGSEQVFIVRKADTGAKELKAAFGAGFQVPEQLILSRKSKHLRLFAVSSVLSSLKNVFNQ